MPDIFANVKPYLAIFAGDFTDAVLHGIIRAVFFSIISLVSIFRYFRNALASKFSAVFHACFPKIQVVLSLVL